MGGSISSKSFQTAVRIGAELLLNLMILKVLKKIFLKGGMPPKQKQINEERFPPINKLMIFSSHYKR